MRVLSGRLIGCSVEMGRFRALESSSDCWWVEFLNDTLLLWQLFPDAEPFNNCSAFLMPCFSILNDSTERVEQLCTEINAFNATTPDFYTTELTSAIPPPKWWRLLMIIVPLISIFGNSLVVLSVFREKSLQTATNYYIVSLAVADLLVSILVMPLCVYNEVQDMYWMLGDTVCDLWVACDVLFCTASIVNLAAISVDRYTAVTQPIKYARSRSSKRTPITLVVCWLVSIGIAAPIVLGANYDNQGQRSPNRCSFFNSQFIIFSSIGSFYVPCVIMLILYWRIFRAIRERARKKAANKTLLPEPSKTNQHRQSKGRISLRVKAKSAHGNKDTVNAGARMKQSIYNTIVTKNRSGAWAQTCSDEEESSDPPQPTCSTTKTNERIDTCFCEPCMSSKQRTITNPGCCDNSPIHIRVDDKHSRKRRSRADTLVPVPCSSAAITSDTMIELTPNGEQSRQKRTRFDIVKDSVTSSFHISASPSSRRSRRSRSKTPAMQRKEKKATKTLAIVLAVFLICWFPFFTANNITAVCLHWKLDPTKAPCTLPEFCMQMFVWLGYFNSFLNPIIYTIFNIEFRKAFKKQLQKPCS